MQSIVYRNTYIVEKADSDWSEYVTSFIQAQSCHNRVSFGQEVGTNHDFSIPLVSNFKRVALLLNKQLAALYR